MAYSDDFVAGVMVGALGKRRARRSQRQQYHSDRRGMRYSGHLEALAERLGLNPAAISRGGPPALATLPGGGHAVVQQGQVAQGKLFPLGQTSIVAAAAGVFAGTLEVRAERSFRPTRLMLVCNLPAQVTVSDISIGTARQLANLAVIPISAFSETATAAWIDFDVIEPGVLASVDFIFTATAASTATISGVYYGTEL